MIADNVLFRDGDVFHIYVINRTRRAPYFC
jgi:hypothetical protein